VTKEYFRQRSFNQGISDSFSDLRREHKCDPYHQKDESLPLPSRRSPMWRRLLRITKRVLQQHLTFAGQLKSAHDAGYAFHQRAFATDPAMRKWVLRSSYMTEITPGEADENRPLEVTCSSRSRASISSAVEQSVH
jgi:hypothetical protein